MRHLSDTIFWSVVGGGLVLLLSSIFGRCLESEDARRARVAASIRVFRVQRELQFLGRALARYAENHGRPPDALVDLARPDPGNLDEPYIDPSGDAGLLDPWDRPYLYGVGDDGSWFVLSLGADGLPGGEDENRDHGYDGP